MKETITIKLKNGNDVSAVLVSSEELEMLKKKFEDNGKSIDECECGDELCIDGYIWSCSRANDNKCKWFKSDWQCNI